MFESNKGWSSPPPPPCGNTMIRQSGPLLGKNGAITLVNGPKYMGTLQGTNISHPKDDVPLGYVSSLEGNWGEMTPISAVIILLMTGRGPHCKD